MEKEEGWKEGEREREERRLGEEDKKQYRRRRKRDQEDVGDRDGECTEMERD